MTEAALARASTRKSDTGESILVVDDRRANQLALTEVLQPLGHNIVTASSGMEALRILLDTDFAVVLLDVNMPVIDGFEVSRLIRARERSAGTPIIFVTAHSTDSEDVRRGYALGAVDYVFTPVVPEILRAKVNVFIQLHQKSREAAQATGALQDLLREKDTLLQEMQHRVKNNLQVISSLISMQVRRTPSAETREALEDCQRRILAVARIHEMLYQTNDYARVPFGRYARTLGRGLMDAAGSVADNITMTFDADDVMLPVGKAIPCGLILSELISNALKHAFPGGRNGVIRVDLRRCDDGRVLLSVADDGVGIKDAEVADTLGLKLVRTLASQLEGTLEVHGDGRTEIALTFDC